MAEPDFEAILDLQAGEAPRPGLCKGVFRLMAKDFELTKSSRKGTPLVRYKCAVLGPHNVDEKLLKDVGNLDGKVEDIDLYLTDQARHRLDDFLHALGVNTKGKTYKQAIPEACNKPFLCEYDWEPIQREDSATGQMKDTGEKRARPRSFAPAPK